MKRILCLGVLMALWALAAPSAVSLAADDMMSIRVSPEVSFAPGHVTVHATIDRADENRAVEFVAESADFYRSSTRHLDGDRAARTTTVEFRSLPRGDYRIGARLLGAGDEVRATSYRAVIVTDPHVTIDR